MKKETLDSIVKTEMEKEGKSETISEVTREMVIEKIEKITVYSDRKVEIVFK